MKKAVTLMELIVVIVIVAILVGLLVPRFIKTRERARDREAITALKLILNAQKVYLDKYARYFPTPRPRVCSYTKETDVTKINDRLKLDLREKDWDYEVRARDCSPVFIDFKGTATRMNPPSGYNRVWTIYSATSQEPTRDGWGDLPQCSGNGCPEGYPAW